MYWFNEHKTELMQEFPDVTNIELTKLAMRKYKMVFASNLLDESTATMKNKRKIEHGSEEDTAKSPLKLTKFENKL